jgi:signal transduction histidine kinase/CheY-like chemotaxis protein
MWRSLHWRTALSSDAAAEQLDELRRSALRLVLQVAAVAYAAWHNAQTFIPASARSVEQAYLIVPVAATVLGGGLLLVGRSRRLAAGFVLVGCLLAIPWAIWVLGSPRPAVLYVLVCCVAALVLHPIGGFGTVAASTVTLAGMAAAMPGVLGPEDVVSAAVVSAAGVVLVWTLTHHLFLALNWYSESYAAADARTREARDHRAELVRAWQQLDHAYFRLERANAALQTAWKAADEAERSKMELATNISHELRTPINMIVGYGELMMSSPATYGGVEIPAPYRGDLTAMYRSAQHLLALTDDVLDLARLEVGRIGLLREPVDLREIARDAATLVRDYVEAKGVELRLALPDEPVLVLVDRVRIRQVLLNLLGNAARFTERGRILVQVEQQADRARASVSDTGPGISAAGLGAVFERFVSTSTAAGRHGGAGLGLPLSRRLVELHGGELSVTSAEGEGTTFWFWLPHGVEAVAPEPAGDRPAQPAPPTRDPGRVVVLAGADEGVARTFRRHLVDVQVETVDRLEEALERARSAQPSVLVVDSDVEYRALPDDGPVVRCALRPPRARPELASVDAYLVKPVGREALLAALRCAAPSCQRVLIVDDDIRFVRLLSRMLVGTGIKTRVAHGGAEALEMLRRDRPDVLLLDLNMPGRDGGEVLSEIEADPRLAGLRVIVVSARDEVDYGLPLGYEVRVAKPSGFRAVEMIQLVGAAINQLAPDRPATTARARPGGRSG